MKPSRAVPHVVDDKRRQRGFAQWRVAWRDERASCSCARSIRPRRCCESCEPLDLIFLLPCAGSALCAAYDGAILVTSFSFLFVRVLVSFRGRTQLFRTGTHTHAFNIYIRVGIRIVLKAVRRIQLYYSWRWRGGPGGHDDGGGGRRRGGDTLWCNTCSGAEAHATSKTPSPARLVYYARAARPRPCLDNKNVHEYTVPTMV